MVYRNKKVKQTLSDIEKLAWQLNITIRYERTKAKGGLCRVDNNYYIIIDSKASSEYRVHVILLALRKFDLSGLYIKPAIRNMIN